MDGTGFWVVIMRKKRGGGTEDQGGKVRTGRGKGKEGENGRRSKGQETGRQGAWREGGASEKNDETEKKERKKAGMHMTGRAGVVEVAVFVPELVTKALGWTDLLRTHSQPDRDRAGATQGLDKQAGTTRTTAARFSGNSWHTWHKRLSVKQRANADTTRATPSLRKGCPRKTKNEIMGQG